MRTDCAEPSVKVRIHGLTRRDQILDEMRQRDGDN